MRDSFKGNRYRSKRYLKDRVLTIWLWTLSNYLSTNTSKFVLLILKPRNFFFRDILMIFSYFSFMTFTTEQLLLERAQKIHMIKYVTGKMKILFELKFRSFVFNPFYPKLPFLYPLNIWENQRFSDVFRGVWNWYIWLKWVILIHNG